VGIWRKHVLEHGADLFERDERAGQVEKRIAELEQLLGRKEVEIALLKNFLGQSR
jgi:hypothetical protein